MPKQKAFPLSVSLYQNEKDVIQAVSEVHNFRNFSQALRFIIFEYALTKGINIQGEEVDENQFYLPNLSKS